MRETIICFFTVVALLTACTNKKDNQNNNDMTEMNLEQKWDKVFPKSEKVNHQKVTFKTQYGLTLAADLYTPKDAEGALPAIAVSGPFGAVKEQSSGFYAQTMAERGFVTLAFDPSYTGESSGEPRRTASPDINTEDFMAAVDYLTTLEGVDAERIGIIGICGWGGIALNAAAADTRIKATLVSTMYDMTRIGGNGYYDQNDNEADRHAAREAMSKARTETARTGTYQMAGGVVDPLPEDAPQFVKDYYAYYKTERGYHERSGNSTDGWHAFGTQAYQNARFLRYTNEIRSAVLMIHGEKAHSRYFGEDAFKNMMENNPVPENKELMIIPGASHCDLYDGGETKAIPFDKIEDFFKTNLK